MIPTDVNKNKMVLFLYFDNGKYPIIKLNKHLKQL